MQLSHYIVIGGRISVCCSTWIQCYYPRYQHNLFNTFTANLITPQVKDFCTTAGPIKLQAVTSVYFKCHSNIEKLYEACQSSKYSIVLRLISATSISNVTLWTTKQRFGFVTENKKFLLHLGPVDVEEWLAQHTEYGTEAWQ